MTRDRRLSWINGLLLPLFNVLTAFLATGVVFLLIGVDPIEATKILIYGALGYDEGLGYTLYYATNFVFTGLAVAVAFHAGLFNIGGEGQAYVGGLGIALVALYINPALSAWIVIPLAISGGLLFGALWAIIPGYLQAYRGSHIVITTIMFNFLASALMVYMLVHVLREVGNMTPESTNFPDVVWLPFVHDVFAGFGYNIAKSPLNLSILVALFFSFLVWFFLWHTRWGFAIRATGKSNDAAIYGGINPKKIIVVTMCISG
ncbi:MAG: ABC transporter permease, partial [Gammaproteobacteria bacterium]